MHLMSSSSRPIWMACGGAEEMLRSRRITTFFPKPPPRERDEFLGAARQGVLVAIHPATQAIFHCLGPGLVDEAFQVIDLLLGCGVTPAAGDVKRDAGADDAPEQLAKGLPRHAAQKVEHGELDQRDRTPESEAKQ